MQIAKIQTNVYSTNMQAQKPVFRGVVSSTINRATQPIVDGLTTVAKQNWCQKSVDWLTKKDPIRHLSAATGVLLSSFYIRNTAKSTKIKEEDKKPLMINMAVVTALSTVGAYTIDKVVNKAINTFTNVFKTVNAEKSNLPKLLNGLKTAKTILVFAFMYRFFAPVIATPIANKLSNLQSGKKNLDAQSLTAPILAQAQAFKAVK